MSIQKDKRSPKRRSNSYETRFRDNTMRSNTHCKTGWEIYKKNSWGCSSNKPKKIFRPEIDLNSKSPSAHKVFNLKNKFHQKKRKRKVRVNG